MKIKAALSGFARSFAGPKIDWRLGALGGLAVAGAVGAVGLSVVGRIPALSEAEQARQAAERAHAEAQVEHSAFTNLMAARERREVEVARGETLALVLARAGADWDDIHAAMAAVQPVFNPRRVRPGQTISVHFDLHDGAAELTGLAFRADPGAAVTVSRRLDGGFQAREILTPLTFEIAHVASEVKGTLYESALKGGATDREVAALSDVFAYDVDFQRDIFAGDKFELVFERFYDDEGRTVRTGDMLFVGLQAREGFKSFYRFKAPGDAAAEWYDATGKTARKFLMKTPINGARLSSNFGMRRHPILGFSKMHKGADFAAPSGTPIMAAGDGVLVKVGFNGGYGRYVRIRHDNQYETAYAHMSAFSRGVRPGARVRQGQVIGYVGSSGQSTGPHLHYEVLVRGQQINPMSMRVPTGRNLSGAALVAFEAERDRIDQMRQPRSGSPPVISAAFAPTATLQE